MRGQRSGLVSARRGTPLVLQRQEQSRLPQTLEAPSQEVTSGKGTQPGLAALQEAHLGTKCLHLCFPWEACWLLIHPRGQAPGAQNQGQSCSGNRLKSRHSFPALLSSWLEIPVSTVQGRPSDHFKPLNLRGPLHGQAQVPAQLLCPLPVILLQDGLLLTTSLSLPHPIMELPSPRPGLKQRETNTIQAGWAPRCWGHEQQGPSLPRCGPAEWSQLTMGV